MHRGEVMAAGHMASTFRKQREMDSSAQLAFAFFFSSVGHVIVPPTVRVGLPQIT